MANLTLSIDDELLRKARVRALEQGTSVNELVRQYLAKLVADERAERARREAWIAEFEALARKGKGGSGSKKWTRESLYERVERMSRKSK
jgi:plasmid stability protein